MCTSASSLASPISGIGRAFPFFRRFRLAALAALAVLGPQPGWAKEAVRLLVMDPLCAQLACDCVAGYAQRRYDKLAQHLERQLGRPVAVAYEENVPRAVERGMGPFDLIVGKYSVVVFDARRANLRVRPIARLVGLDGATSQRGLFVVRADDPAKTIDDLKGRAVVFGPEESAEKRSAALAALAEHGIPAPKEIRTAPGCSAAAFEVIEKRADAGVISSYALALLEGCDTIDKGALRVVGKTRPVPFITVFATTRVSPDQEQAILRALAAVGRDPALLEALESKSGFVPTPKPAPGWPGFRGPNRTGFSPDVPAKLPSRKRLLWQRELTGLGLSGIVATSRHVVVADKGPEAKRDVFRCLDADTGVQLWALSYPAPGDMDYTNSPRATPAIHDGRVYLLGAFGHLHCVELDTGKVLWRRHLVQDFGARLVQWGACSSPLVVDDKLIVNPGAKDAALVALDLRTGKVLWKTPGRAAAYASFIVAKLGGVRQVVGYDATTLGGWDPQTGKRLWEFVPEFDGDFNVPTPIAVDGKLLVATENNGTRLYGFDTTGRIRPKPLASTEDLVPDTSTPVVANGLVFGCSGSLFCLDLKQGLKTLWEGVTDRAYDDYVSIIAGRDRLLIAAVDGELLLVEAGREKYRLVSRLRLFEDSDVWSHPALVRDRLYVRNDTSVVCVLLSGD